MKRLKTLLTAIVISMTVSSWTNGQPKPQLGTVTSNGVSIAYEVRGNDPIALVFVHGWSCDRSYWKSQMEWFSRKYEVVAVDLGGHGESGLGRKDWTISSFGRDVAAVVKHLGLKNVILIGHSMGGDVIPDAALLLPNLVRGLVMVDAYKNLGSGRSPEQVSAFVNKFGLNFRDSVRSLVRGMFLPGADPALVAFVADDMSSAPPAVALSALESSFTHSRQITHDFELLKLPLFAINPDNGPTDFESMQRHGVHVVIMKGVGHFAMMEDAKQFNDLLESVIQKIK